MQVTICMLDYSNTVEAVPVVVTQQFEEAPPQIFDPGSIANQLDFIAGGGALGDDGVEALKIAVELFRSLDTVLDLSEVSKIVVGEIEKGI